MLATAIILFCGVYCVIGEMARRREEVPDGDVTLKTSPL